jgi:hypothetical protein
MTAPAPRKQSTIIALRHPFACRTKSSFAHRIALRVPTGVGALDAVSNFHTVAAVCGRASHDLLRFAMDAITGRPERAAVIDEDDPSATIAVDEAVWRAIERANTGAAIRDVLQAYIALLI